MKQAFSMDRNKGTTLGFLVVALLIAVSLVVPSLAKDKVKTSAGFPSFQKLVDDFGSNGIAVIFCY